MTVVINVRGLDREALLADPTFAYVGRAVPRAGWKASAFGNPFGRAMPTADPRLRVELFAMWLNGSAFADAFLTEASERVRYTAGQSASARRAILDGVAGLRGRRLGCWCCDWAGEGEGKPSAPCHAVLLALLADRAEVPR